MFIPFYDPAKTFDENFADGPFGIFSDSKVFENRGEPQFKFFGEKVFLPFGIPAGPLPNAKFCAAAFRRGFDLPVYKTVRTKKWPCAQFPNIVPVEVSGDLTLQKAAAGLQKADDYDLSENLKNLAITNSFGVPSNDPEIWQPDLKKAVESAGRGQILVASFQGTGGESLKNFIDDHVLAAKLVAETGAKILELNLSCPNEGKANLLCFDTETVLQIAEKIKMEIGDRPLILKLAFFENDEHLENFVAKLGKVVDGFAAINTIAAEVRDKNGEPALPGENRLRSGVCGAPIKWAGISMTKRLKNLRAKLGLNFTICGVGGVCTPSDFKEFRDAGADAVFSATGAMWNGNLAEEVKSQF
jgi:dihydroorotate dehydrogenase